jgi:NADPH:quinone reductase-like Zn-dependent oxidoreductase
MAKVVRVHELGEPEVMRIEELPVRAPGEGEVHLRVEAIGLNRSEAVFRRGAYPQRPTLPTLIGYEGVGIVQAIGPGVLGFTPGDRVCVVPNYRLGEYGMYAEETVVPARSLLHAPPGLSSAEAASIWMQFFTAMAIIEIGKATVGDYVIIPAASSSVGLAAIQLANWAGATPIAATRRSDKAAALKAHGAKHVVAQKSRTWSQKSCELLRARALAWCSTRSAALTWRSSRTRWPTKAFFSFTAA